MPIQLDGWRSPQAWRDAGKSGPPLAELTDDERIAADEASQEWGMMIIPDTIGFAIAELPDDYDKDDTLVDPSVAPDLPVIAMGYPVASGGWNIFVRNGTQALREWDAPSMMGKGLEVGGVYWLLKTGPLNAWPLSYQAFALSAAAITLFKDYPDLISANNRIQADDADELFGYLWPSVISRVDNRFKMGGAFAAQALSGYPKVGMDYDD